MLHRRFVLAKIIIHLYIFQPGGIRRLCNILHECFCNAVSQFYLSRSWRSLISWPASFPFTQVKSWQHGEISQRLAAETGLFFKRKKKSTAVSFVHSYRVVGCLWRTTLALLKNYNPKPLSTKSLPNAFPPN